MAKKKSSRLVRIPEPGLANLEVDKRPERSPFASDTCSLYFQNKGPLHIHQSFLDNNTKLASKCRPSVFGQSLRTIHFDDVTLDTGHVLVNFLITGEYSCLKPKGESMDERHASEFTTALHVSGVAESYGLSGLRDLAMNEMQKLGDKLTMFSLIRIMEEARPTPVRIPEVAAYIRSRMQDFYNIPTIEAGEEVLSVSGTPQTIGELVLKSVVEIHLQELSVEKQAPQGVNGEGTSPATKIGESMLIEKQEPEPEPFDGREQEQPPRVQDVLENPFLNPLLPHNAAKNDSPVPTSSINPMPRIDKKQKKKKSETASPPAIFEPTGHPNDNLFQISGPTLVPTHFVSPESPSHEPLTPGSGDDTHGLQLDCANRSDHLATNGDWKNCSNCRKLVRLFSHELDMAHE